jgi:hypothetical protein
MKTLLCKGCATALVLSCSGCAGSLENPDAYDTRPVREGDGGVPWTPAAGRAAAGAAGASKPAGAGGWTAGAAGSAKPAGSGGASGQGPNAGGETDPEDAGAGDASVAQTPVEMSCNFPQLMAAKCGNPNCHGAPGESTGLDLTTPMLAARVEGRMGKGACSDKLLVDKDNPRESKLFLKVSGSTCGTQMPLGGALNAEEEACVLTWIEKL